MPIVHLASDTAPDEVAAIFVEHGAPSFDPVDGEHRLVDTGAGIFRMKRQVGSTTERGGSGEFTRNARDRGLGGLFEREVGGVEVDLPSRADPPPLVL